MAGCVWDYRFDARRGGNDLSLRAHHVACRSDHCFVERGLYSFVGKFDVGDLLPDSLKTFNVNGKSEAGPEKATVYRFFFPKGWWEQSIASFTGKPTHACLRLNP